MSATLPDVLTIQETAQYLRIPLRSLYKLAHEGKIPCQKVGRHWRFHRDILIKSISIGRPESIEKEYELM